MLIESTEQLAFCSVTLKEYIKCPLLKSWLYWFRNICIPAVNSIPRQILRIVYPMQILAFVVILLQLAFCRVPESERTFVSEVVDQFISEIKPNFKDQELANLFESCYPNTLDTTVYSFTESDTGDEDTFLITGDITAMWLRDSTNQVRVSFISWFS